MTMEESRTQSARDLPKTKLRVAMISNYLPGGSKIGVGYQAHALANGLADLGHEVTVFSSCAAVPDARYRTVRLPETARWRTFGFAWRLRDVDFSEFDVLHAHGDDYWLWRRRAPVHIRTMHGSCMAEALRIPGLREKIRMTALGLTEVLATVVADRTVLVSPQTRRWLPWVKAVVPNGVEPHFYPDPSQRSEHPSILFVGTYGNRKRGRLLMDVFAQEIRPRLPEARLTMVCSDAPAADAVTVTGRVSATELAEHFRRAWVFCLPSSYEGFGIPYAEALVSGVPVVATRNPGANYVLDGGRAGVLCDPDDLGRRLLDLLTDPAARSTAAARGTERGSAFTLQSVLSHYLALYQEVREERSDVAA